MHQFLCIADFGPEYLTYSLVSQAYPEYGDFSCQMPHHIFTNARIRRLSRSRRQDNQLRGQLHYGIRRHFIVTYHMDIRVYGTDQLIQIIRKAVVIIYQQNHPSIPPSAVSSAILTAFALLMHSWYSFSGSLSATIPAPERINTLPFLA